MQDYVRQAQGSAACGNPLRRRPKGIPLRHCHVLATKQPALTLKVLIQLHAKLVTL